jgi:hypothetical protein
MSNAIREAIGRGEFERAAVLWREWSKGVGERRDPSEWARFVELYCWASPAALCARAQLQDRWNTLQAARAYVTYP